MNINDIMTRGAQCVGPSVSLIRAADLMRELGVGFLPICENDRLIGTITDRDITIRGVAEARDMAGTPVSAIMSPEIVYVYEDQDVGEAARLMEVKQIRRLLVMDREKKLVGVVSLGDLAVGSGIQLSGEALKEISQPVHSGVS